jgi:large subunit ribosomal protein L24
MASIKKGDLVVVITGGKAERGGDKGKTGRVLSVNGDRVIVEGINLVTKHKKVAQTERGTKTGGIETAEAAIHISNVALVDPETKKATRLGVRLETVTKNGVAKTNRIRVAKKSGKDI